MLELCVSFSCSIKLNFMLYVKFNRTKFTCITEKYCRLCSR